MMAYRNWSVLAGTAAVVVVGLAGRFVALSGVAAQEPSALPAVPPAAVAPPAATPTTHPETVIAQELGVLPPSPPPGGLPVVPPSALPATPPVAQPTQPDPKLPDPAPIPVPTPEPKPLPPQVEKTLPKPKMPEPQPEQPPAFQPLNSAASDVANTGPVGKAGSGVGVVAKSVPFAKGANTFLPSVTVEKSGPASGHVGDLLRYQIIVRNDGPTPINDLLVVDVIPVEAEVVETVPKAVGEGPRVLWKLDTLPPGKEERLLVSIRPRLAGELNFESATYLQMAKKPMVTRVTEQPMQISVDAPDKVAAGQKLPVKIKLKNQGEIPQGGLRLTISMPEGISHPQMDAKTRAIEADLPVILAGDTKIIDVSLESAKPGTHVVKLELGDSAKNTIRKEFPVTVQEAPGLVLKKIGLPVMPVGKLSEYKVEVINQGLEDVQNVVVSEQLPEGVEFVEASDKGVFTAKTRTIQWQLGTLRAGHGRAVGVRMIGQRPGEVVDRISAQAGSGGRVDLTARLQVLQP